MPNTGLTPACRRPAAPRLAWLGVDLALAKVPIPVGGVARIADDVPVGQAQVITNKQIGDSAADSIAARFPGARREVTLQAQSGARRLDVLTSSGHAIESKVGRTSLTVDTRRQIGRDLELLADDPRVASVEWEFFVSPITGKGGPTAPLARALEDAGIPYAVHTYGPGI